MENNKKTLVDIGIDISTAIIGISLINSKTHETVATKAIIMNKSSFKNFDRFDKADYFQKEFKNFLCVENASCEVNRVFVEEAHMRFSPGFSSANTLFALARFNETIRYIIYKDLNLKPIPINVRSARSKLKIKTDKSTDTKEQVLNAVISFTKNEEHVIWPTHVVKMGKNKGKTVYNDECEDIADSWVICRGGQIIIKK